jgi:hypothetical protein
MSAIIDNLEEVLEAIVASAGDGGHWSSSTNFMGADALKKIGYTKIEATIMMNKLSFYAVLEPLEEIKLTDITLEEFCKVLG